MQQPEPQPRPNNGLPRWLVVAIASKMALAVAIVGAVVWWAGR